MVNVSELYGRTLGTRAEAQAAGQAAIQEQVTSRATEQNVAFQKSESIKKLESKTNEVKQQASDIDIQIKQQNEWVNKSVDDDTLSGEVKSGIVKQYNENVRMLNAEKSQLTSQIPVYNQFISEIKALPQNQYYDPNQIVDIALKTGHEQYLQSAYVQAKAEPVKTMEQKVVYGATPPSFKPEYSITRTDKFGNVERVIYSPEGKEIGSIPITGRSGGAAVTPQVIATKPPVPEIVKGFAKYIGITKQIGEAVSIGLSYKLESPAAYTKEELARQLKISEKPKTILGYPQKVYEYVKLTDEMQAKVNEAAKFTEKVTPIINKEFKDLTKYDNQYANSVNDYNKFLESKGTKKPDGTYELSEENYNDALSYEKSLGQLKTALDNKINEVKDNFKANDIQFKDKADGLEITDERIKRIGKLETYSQAYLKEMSSKGKLGQGLATLGTLGVLETAGWVVALTPILGAVGKLPIIKSVVGIGKYIAKPVKVASALTIGAGLTASAAYSRYKEYLPLGTQVAKLGAVSGAAEMIGGYALGATLINIVDNVNLQKNVKENILNILKDKSGELSPEKRKAKAKQQLIQVEKDVSNKIEFTKEQADFAFKQANYERQKEIVKNILRRINALPIQEEKLQGLLDLTGFLKRNIGKEQAKTIVQEIFTTGQRAAVSYGGQLLQAQRPMVMVSVGRLKQAAKPIALLSLASISISRTAQAQRQVQKTSQQLSQRLKQEQKIMQASVQASAQKYAQQVKQAQALAQKQEQKLMQQLKQPQLQAQRQEQAQKQIYKQAQQLIQRQKSMQEQILRQTQRLKVSLRIRPTPSIIEKKIKIGIPTFEFEDESAKKRKELEAQSEQAYQALIKRRGKYLPTGKLLPRAEAIRAGERIARQTLAATFKIVPTKFRVKAVPSYYKPSPVEFRGFKIEKGRRVPLVDTYIQEAKYRLSTRGEVAEIQRARRLSHSMTQKAKLYLKR